MPILPRSAYLRQTTRRKMAPGLPSRLPLRALPTLNGIPLPPHARRCQSTASALAPHVPNDSQGLHSYTCVLVPTDFVVSNYYFDFGDKCLTGCSRLVFAEAERTLRPWVRASLRLRVWRARRSQDVISCIARLGLRTPFRRVDSDTIVARLGLENGQQTATCFVFVSGHF